MLWRTDCSKYRQFLFFYHVEIKWLVRWCFNQGEDNYKVRMKYFQWWQPVWWQWEILHVSTFILGFILAHWMWLKGNAGLQFLHQQNGDNISTYASHFKWKALHSCKIALSCQYTTEIFTFCLEHFIKIPPHMEQNNYYRLPKMWFLGSWQCHLHLCTFVFQISCLATKFTIIWQFLQKKNPDHTAPGFASLVTIPLCTSPGCCLCSRMWLAGSWSNLQLHTWVLEQTHIV